ncbi:uncharacterized protein [Blastocystis hominis]|uniref:Uncharacterized protein n=1 Tax=Blastocystis hominis TaxID=12968 RepID=D8LXG9_BLAHO|nr:uncharacterized protein [Blastocystis hominis]CBK20964.2 unnamed protein product [Blastocystis hominis]|eukprot:XP_012895012.1 uncharacterized protein [Blastocystis hominis]
MSQVVIVVPRRLLKFVSNDDYLDNVQKATNALFLARCFLNTFMKECTDEELLEIFEVPKISDAIITPSNYSRATLIRTYGKTSYTLIETVVDVIVSHSPQQQTNKLYMEAMGVLITLFSRMLRNNDIDHAISAVSPYYSPYFFLDLLFICSGMPLIAETPATRRKDVPHWSAVLIMSLLRRMCQNDVDKLDSAM